MNASIVKGVPVAFGEASRKDFSVAADDTGMQLNGLKDIGNVDKSEYVRLVGARVSK